MVDAVISLNKTEFEVLRKALKYPETCVEMKLRSSTYDLLFVCKREISAHCSFMGYNEKELFEIVNEHNRKKDEEFAKGQQWTPEQFKQFNKEKKMTREEAIRKHSSITQNYTFSKEVVKGLEALGLIKFDEPKAATKLYDAGIPEFGIVRLEQWNEGLVLWVGGKIVWRSWTKALELHECPYDEIHIERGRLVSLSTLTGMAVYSVKLSDVRKALNVIGLDIAPQQK